MREERPLGTGGAIRLALSHCYGDGALVVNGDTFLAIDYADMYYRWKQFQIPLIAALEVDDTGRYGAMTVDDNDRIMGLTEKGRIGRGIINAGSYLLSRDILDAWKPGESFSFEVDFLPHALATGYFLAYRTKAAFLDIGIPEDYERAPDFFDALSLR